MRKPNQSLHLKWASSMWRLKFLEPSLGHREQRSMIPAQPCSSSCHQKDWRGYPALKACRGIDFVLIFTMRLTIKTNQPNKKQRRVMPWWSPTRLSSNCWKTELHLAGLLSKICDFFGEHTAGRGLLNNPSVPFRSTACRWRKHTGSLRQQSGLRIIRPNLRRSAYLCPFKDSLQSAGRRYRVHVLPWIQNQQDRWPEALPLIYLTFPTRFLIKFSEAK